jgi:carboxypeptidase C (cathepsin A)
MYPVFAENGPCYANPDFNSTRLNPWSFNNNVNMLYIDQPNQVGFSYDKIVEGSYNVIDGSIFPEKLPQNQTTISGKFASQNPGTTANTTVLVARALWHFAQVWFEDFPEFKSCERKISIWGNSYGGYYSTGTLAYFQSQNMKILNGTLDRKTNKVLPIDTLGITNGCVDLLYQGPSYATLPYNNTYDLELFNKTVSEAAMNNFTKPGGCSDEIHRCRALGAEGDPYDLGTNATVNSICFRTYLYCQYSVAAAFALTGVSPPSPLPSATLTSLQHQTQDFTAPIPNPNPPTYPIGFLNQKWVQDALGVPLNLTYFSNNAQNTLFAVGDSFRRSIANLDLLLTSGVNVALAYGDRDFSCNWVGAENLTLHATYPSASEFRASGYEDITTNASYTGGVVRQYENFSFARVYDAAHYVSYSQPETMHQIFNRAMFHRDVATGEKQVEKGKGYRSQGPASAWGFKNKVPEQAKPECSVWTAGVSCSEGQLEALEAGTAVVENYIVLQPEV